MHTPTKEAIERIQHMELLFDRLQQAFDNDPASIHADTTYQADLNTLVQYYENGLWLEDYTLDEQGLLPATLKRGVLSQDGLYDFLDRLQEQ